MNHRIFCQNFVLLAFDKSKTQLRSVLGSTLCPHLLLEGVRCPIIPWRLALPCHVCIRLLITSNRDLLVALGREKLL